MEIDFFQIFITFLVVLDIHSILIENNRDGYRRLSFNLKAVKMILVLFRVDKKLKHMHPIVAFFKCKFYVETAIEIIFQLFSPDLFYLPELLVNNEGFDFGNKQNGERVDDVVLPAWARGDPRLFIKIHRQALESDHVRGSKGIFVSCEIKTDIVGQIHLTISRCQL